MRGAEVKKIREDQGLNQSEFARRYNLCLRSLQRWEAGGEKLRPSTQIMLKLIRDDPGLVHEVVQEVRGW